jgi:hypothetical protein
MSVAHEISTLMPSSTFIVELLVLAVAFAVLVLWPLVGAVLRRQPGWVLGIVVLGPMAGIAWLASGRRQRDDTVPSAV